MRTVCLTASIAFVLLSHAVADTPKTAATAVLEAIRVEKPGSLRILAQRNDPDPWLVAHELCAQKEYLAAEMFVRAAPRADTAKLALQIALWEKDPDAPALMAATMKATVTSEGATAEQHREAALAAAKIGWLRRAADEHRAAAKSFHNAGNADDALAAAMAWLAVEVQRDENARLKVALLEAGRLAHDANRNAEAEDLLRRALRQAQRRPARGTEVNKDDAQRGIASAEATLARTLARRGELQDARAYLRRAHDTFSRLNDDASLLFVLREFIGVDRAIDGIEAGIRRAQEMLSVAKRSKNAAAQAEALEALAGMERERGALAISAGHFEGAEAIYRVTKDNASIARVTLQRGVLLTRMGRLVTARSVLRASLKAAGNSEASKSVRARTHAALGEVALDQGDAEEAEKQLAQAAALSKDPKLLARTLAQNGRLQLRMGKTAKAYETLEHALTAMSAAELPVERLHASLDQGEAARRLNKLDIAAEIVSRARNEARRWKDSTALARTAALDALLHLETEPADALIKRVRNGAREAINLLEAKGSTATLAFDRAIDRLLRVGTDAAIRANDAQILLAAGEYGRSRRMTRRLGGRAALMRAMTPTSLATKIQKLFERREDLVVIYQDHRTKLNRDAMLKARDQIKKIDAEVIVLEKQREAGLEPARWMLSPARLELDALTGALGAQETLLYFCVGTERVAVLKVSGAGPSIIDLGDRKTLDAGIAKFRTELHGDAPEAAIATMRQMVFVPLGIAEGHELAVVPAAPFDDVAFCAIAPEHTVRFLTGATELVRLKAESHNEGTGILGIGDPDFGTGDQRNRLVNLRNGVPLRRLETAAKLAEEIGDVTLVTTRATEQQLRDALQQRTRWKAIHFSAPGLLDSNAPWRSSIALAADKTQDGYLTGADLIQLRLPAELSVLAACEPAKGTENVGAAIQGMVEAVHLAGSARVLISRWMVDDATTTKLLSHFYSYWKDGKTPAPMALRRAQERVRQASGMGHPKHWAGWELWGAR